MATPIRSYLHSLASLRTEVRLAKMCMEAELAQRRTGEYPATMDVWDPFNQSPFGYEVVDGGYRVWVNSGPNTIELDFGTD